jgi:hypothetical protein
LLVVVVVGGGGGGVGGAGWWLLELTFLALSNFNFINYYYCWYAKDTYLYNKLIL